MPLRTSPFIDPAAVEAWDAWFRWRDHAGLHDFSIEDTWRRVAGELASVESPTDAELWRSRFLQALSGWQLLPDERLLASAGTGLVTWREGDLHASLNVAGFVSTEEFATVQMDLPRIADCAAVAVRALDNAALLAGTPHPRRLRIGLVGVADALFLLGLGYDSEEGRAMASALGRALAEGCFDANIALARERGACNEDISGMIVRGAQRGLRDDLLGKAKDSGLRHPKLTAITSRSHLALLANVVADALDPLAGKNHPHVFVTPRGERILRSSGYALSVSSADATRDTKETAEFLGWPSQLRMRSVMQPYMDEPITYPLQVAHEPDGDQRREATLQAARYGLGAPAWGDASIAMYGVH
ncbi:MAG TPA: hypothetical protein VFH52_10010 [Rhodanobacteraceae bacterium]|nr:hypothetical protein [Rhodanobacteraceae bacterium]